METQIFLINICLTPNYPQRSSKKRFVTDPTIHLSQISCPKLAVDWTKTLNIRSIVLKQAGFVTDPTGIRHKSILSFGVEHQNPWRCGQHGFVTDPTGIRRKSILGFGVKHQNPLCVVANMDL